MRSPLAPVLLDLAAGRSLNRASLSAGACAQALEHRVGGLVATELLHGRLTAPPDWERRLAAADATNQLWHEQQLAMMRQATELLDRVGLPHLFIKGAANSERWYGRGGERVSLDVDVVLSPYERSRWVEAVDTLAPREMTSIRGMSDLDLLKELAIKVPLGGGDLDVHFDLIKYGVPSHYARDIWDRRQAFQMSDGTEISVLDPETALIQQLVELNRDRFRYLQSFAEIARIMRTESVDWSYIDWFVSREGIREPIFLSLRTVLRALQLKDPYPLELGGWKVRLWKIAWPPRNQLQGDLGAVQWRQRERLLSFYPSGRRREAAAVASRYFFPPSQRLEAIYPDERGPYLWRNLWPRVRHWWVRRTVTNELRRRDSAEIRKQPYNQGSGRH